MNFLDSLYFNKFDVFFNFKIDFSEDFEIFPEKARKVNFFFLINLKKLIRAPTFLNYIRSKVIEEELE